MDLESFDTEFFTLSDLDLGVTEIHVLGYQDPSSQRDEGSSPCPPSNHWVLFLQVQPPKATSESIKPSVRVDMLPGHGNDGLGGKVALLSKRYPFSANYARIFSFSLCPGITVKVKYSLSLIILKRRHKYRFTPDVEGCRWWVSVFVGDLEEERIIPKGSKGSVWESIIYYWASPARKKLKDVSRRTFGE